MNHQARSGEPQEQSVAAAFGRIVEASEKVILDRVDLLRLEAETMLSNTVWSGVFGFLGAGLFLLSWLALMSAIVLWLNRTMSAAASVAIVGVGNALLGAAVMLVGVRPRGEERRG